MKNKVFVIVIALVALFAVGCTNNNNDEFTEEDALLLEDQFMDKVFPDREDDGEVKKFNTKEELVDEISKVSEEYIAKSFVDTYYEERDDSLYVRGMDEPIRILKDKPIELKKNEDEYEVSQDGEDELKGSYTFIVKYTKRDNEWVIKERIFEQRDSKDGNKNEDEKENETNEEIISEFNDLLEKDSSLEDVITFVDDNISSVSKEDASEMVYKLENLQKKDLTEVENKINSDDKFQETLRNKDNIEVDMDKLDVIKDDEVKNTLIKLRDSGYKIETSEGMYFPVIDYGFYRDYKEHVNNETSDYIEIMANESENRLAKDAALTVSWDELVNSALNQEKFIENYSESERIDDIEEKYENYVKFVFFGLDNTPLFSYEDKTIDSDAKDAYSKIIDTERDSILQSDMEEFLKIVEENDNKLTEQVEKHREDIVQKNSTND